MNFCKESPFNVTKNENNFDITVGLFPNEILKKFPHSVLYCHKCIFLFDILEKNLNLSVQVNFPQVNNGGAVTKSGNWTGAIGLLANKLADIYLVPFSYSSSRAEVMSFPYLMLSDTLLAILSSPRLEIKHKLIFFTEYFDKITLILFASSFLTLILLIYLNLKNILVTFFLAIDLFVISIGRAISIPLNVNKFLLISWIISTYFLVILLQNDILSLLITKNIHKIESIQQLFEENDVNILITNGWPGIVSLKLKYPFSESRLEFIEYKDNYRPKTIERLLDHKHVLINSEKEVDGLLNHYRHYGLIKTGKSLSPYFYGFTFGKNLDPRITNKFIRLIKSLYNYGLLIYFDKREVAFNVNMAFKTKKIFEKKKSPHSISENIQECSMQHLRNLNLKDFKLCFVISTFGSIISFVTLLFEYIYKEYFNF